MSTDTTWQINTISSEETEKIGEQLGQQLRGSEVIELMSDLGGGKTTLTRGIVRGIGSADHVSSPTFTISKVYKSPRLYVHHFDFYRLNEPGLVAHELADTLGQNDAVTIIEWGEIVRGVLPEQRITVELKRISESERQISVTVSKDLEYVLPV